MRNEKRKRLEAKGWRVGTVREFLRLSPKEAAEVERYIAKRKVRDPVFAHGFEPGYAMFELGVRLKTIREDAHLTQAAAARKLRTTASAISRIENHTENIRLSTLQRYAKVLGVTLIFDLGDPDRGGPSNARLWLLRKLAVARAEAASGIKGKTHEQVMASLRLRIKTR
jgi:HTH-type transcriptional regulator/antitoxin HipB